ncbi:MAG: ABC transporter ATP-binding protein [Rhizomicrobium sp.]
MPDTVIIVENLSKSYLVGHRSAERERYTALRDVIGREARLMVRKAFDLVRGKQIVEGDDVEEFWALRHVNFEVKQGEVLGVIGRNGAGKSTLLKILSRITDPTEGRITLRGRVASLLEVGTGFHPELTGRENIFLNGAVLGMSRAEIKRKFDEIVAFSEVEKFLDTPVKRYSSGMYVRLAFAVAAHLDPEILVVDEVLAVGDAQFQKKCLGKMSDVARGGRTVLFVSHNMNAVERLCRRVLWLEQGKVAGIFSDVRQGTMTYLGHSGEKATINAWWNDGREYDNDYFRPEHFEISSDAQNAVPGSAFSNVFPLTFRVTGEIRIVDPAFNLGFAVYAEDGTPLFWTFMKDIDETNWPLLRRGPVEFRVSVPARLLNEGTYRVELLSGLYCRGWFMEPGVNAPVVEFHIQGGLSDSPYWDGKRPGLLAPVLNWELNSLDLDKQRAT